MTISLSLSLSEGAINPSMFETNPISGNSFAFGSSNITSSPSSFVMVSLVKSKSKRPVKDIAITVSGEPMNDKVAALPSLRAGKFLLNEDIIVFSSPCL